MKMSLTYLQCQVLQIVHPMDKIFQQFIFPKISNFEQNSFILHSRDKDYSLQHHLHKSSPADIIPIMT